MYQKALNNNQTVIFWNSVLPCLANFFVAYIRSIQTFWLTLQPENGSVA